MVTPTAFTTCALRRDGSESSSRSPSEWRRRDNAQELYQQFRGIGRALGNVRDTDVRMVLLKYIESRVPTAAPSLVLVRQQLQRERLHLMRKLIKQLEKDELSDLLRETASSTRMPPDLAACGETLVAAAVARYRRRPRKERAPIGRHATGV
jgi:CHAD domain-containing protein